jgi:hypothetical protein
MFQCWVLKLIFDNRFTGGEGGGYMVAQLLEALCYKLGCHGFHS